MKNGLLTISGISLLSLCLIDSCNLYLMPISCCGKGGSNYAPNYGQ
jgi:hypothetical protein